MVMVSVSAGCFSSSCSYCCSPDGYEPTAYQRSWEDGRSNMVRNRERGAMRGNYALDPFLMARVCRRLAAEIRVEAAAGRGRIALRRPLGEAPLYVTRDDTHHT